MPNYNSRKSHMKSINDLKIGVRLGLVFTLIVIATSFGFIYTSLKTHTIKDELDKIYKVNLLSMEYLIEADRDAYQSSVAISQVLAINDPSNTESQNKLIGAIEENIAQVDQRYSKFENISNVSKQGGNQSINQKFHDNYSRISVLTKDIINKLKSGNYDEAKAIYFGEYSKVFDDMRGAMDQFTTISLDNAEASYNASVSISDKILINSISLTIIIILFIVITAILITKSITKPIDTAVQFLENVSNGDLTVKISDDISNRKDEVGTLLKSLSSMVNKLNTMLSNVKQNVVQITTASQQLSTTSQQLSEGANEQAASVEEISSTIEEISANIQQNSNNAIETQKISNISVTGLNNVNKASNESLNSINEISGKITIINDIAFQTNILALNAAVEAARAGEHGRGFAVVAAEVRKLAERSKLSADEIISLSNTSVKKTEDAVKQMNDIMPEISKTSNLVEEIASASREQSNGADQVNNAVQQLNNVTQQNATAAEELASNAQQLQSQADSLLESISQFKTTENKDTNTFKRTTEKKYQEKKVIVEKKREMPHQQTGKKAFKLNLDDNDKGYENF